MDYSHCGPGGFSPPAPKEMCEQVQQPVNQVPEPSTAWLLAIALIAVYIVNRQQRNTNNI